MARHVAELMDAKATTVTRDVAFKEVARLISELGISAIPVIDEDGRVVGMVSEADLIVKDESLEGPWLRGRWTSRATRKKVHAMTVGELMTAPAVTIDPNADIAETATFMRKRRIKRLPVCDTEGRLLGVVSRVDLIREFLRDDEQIADEVDDVLRRKMSLPKEQVGFTVVDGVVTLDGRVEHRSQVPAIVERIRRIPGIVEVLEQLRWSQDDSTLAQGPVPWVGM